MSPEAQHVQAIYNAIKAVTDLASLERDLAGMDALAPFNAEVTSFLDTLERKLVIAQGYLKVEQQ